MARPSVTVSLLLAVAVTLSLLAVTHGRLLVPTATDPNTSVAVPDERDPPEPTAESADSAAATEQFVVVPVRRFADRPDLLRELGVSLRFPAHRRHPCRHGHGLRWWAHHLHGHHGHRLAHVPSEWTREEEEEEEELKRVPESDVESDTDSDSDGEEEEEEEMERRWMKERKDRRFGHHGRRHHHHRRHGEEEEEEEGGVLKWFRDLVDRF